MPMLTIQKLLPTWSVLLLVSVATRCACQSFEPPTAAQCDSAVALAQSDLHSFFTDSPIASCGVTGARAIAAALPRMSTEQDPSLLSSVSATSGMRDASIFGAAISLAGNSGATPDSRFAAILILAQQELGVGAALMPSSDSSGLAAFADTSVFCAVAAGDTTFTSGDPLPGNHLDQTKATVGALAQNSAVTPALRRAAKCLRNQFSPPILPSIDPSLIHGSYICGTRFKVTNNSPLTVELGFEIPSVEPRATFMAAAGHETTFSTEYYGTVRLYYGDQLLQSLSNANTKC